MRYKTVAEVMTTNVTTVRADTSFRDVVETLDRHRISGAPVLDAEGHCVGMVTEADLLARQARLGGPTPGTVWSTLWRKAFARKSEATTARQAMTQPVVTVMADASVAAAAAILARHNLRSAPVIDSGGELAGIVSRRDVLSVYTRPDDELAEAIRRGIVHGALSLSPDRVSAQVHDGVVTLRGVVEPSTIGLVGSLVASVDGVVEVRNLLVADTARALMHAGVVTVAPMDTVVTAAQQMRAAQVGSLLVVNTVGALSGVVTDRDLVVRCVAEGMDAATTPIATVATGDVVTVDARRHIDDVLALLREHRVHRLPVVAYGRPIGVISRADIARRLPRRTLGRLVAEQHDHSRAWPAPR
ncbi:CBS domain-containing protein [Nocardia sp. NPDC003345]